MYSLQELLAALDRLNNSFPDDRTLDIAVNGKSFIHAETGERKLYIFNGGILAVMLTNGNRTDKVCTFRVIEGGSDYSRMIFEAGNDVVARNMIRHRS